MQFYGHRSADAAARELSLRNPTQAYYVNCVEGNEHRVDTFPEHDDQPYWLNGVLQYGEPLLDTTPRTVWLNAPLGLCLA